MKNKSNASKLFNFLNPFSNKPYKMSDHEFDEEDPTLQKTCDLIEFDPSTPLTEEVLNDFDIDPEKVKTINFTDEKGMPQSYDTVRLTYKGLPPYILLSDVESYGAQLADFKGKADDKKKGGKPGEYGMNGKGKEEDAAPVPGMIKLPPTIQMLDASFPEGAAAEEAKDKLKKRKVQVALKLTEKPHPDQWTPQEVTIIGFLENGLRRIWAHVLSRHLAVLNAAHPSIIPAVQEEMASEFQDPAVASKYNTAELQQKYMIEKIRRATYNKFTKKVYRKKIKAVPGQKFDMNANPYDLTSCPGLYPIVRNFIDAAKNEEICSSKFDQLVDGEFVPMTLDDALKYGRCRITISVLFDNSFLGSAVLSPKIEVGEVVFLEKIASKSGYSGRMISISNVPRDRANIVTRKVGMEPGNTPVISAPAPTKTIDHGMVHQNLGPQAFDPSGFTSLAPAPQTFMINPVQRAE